MHELGIVFHIIRTVEDVGKENKLSAVSEVTLEVGEVSGIVDTYLQDCWRWAADRSALLAGSKLVIERIPAVTFCEHCGQTYGTVAHGKICPHCGSGETYLLEGNACNIKQIEAC
jgi:hydrogenase nickel incorporation protein HypA/HybF